MKFSQIIVVFSITLIVGYKSAQSGSSSNVVSEIRERIKERGELAPFPEAIPLLTKIAAVIDSSVLKDQLANSRTLQMLRERVRTSLFHVNLQFEVTVENYPYEAPFEAPYPFRPTLEAIDEAANFLRIVRTVKKFDSGLEDEIAQFKYFGDLKALFPKSKSLEYSPPLSLDEINTYPVESYIIFQERLEKFGEVAPFPEFAQPVEALLTDFFENADFRKFRKSDPAFDILCAETIRELKALQLSRGGPETTLHAAFSAPYPYRKTIQAIERAVLVNDLRDRLKYPLGINWHDVEVSWLPGNSPKLLPLYHFNRYKYQMAGLLADHEMVLLPFAGGVGFEDLIRQRAAPIGMMEISTQTHRIDRHYNSPLDDLYHDANHIRRMWGYDQRQQERRGATTKAEKMAIYREQDAFLNDLFRAMSPRNAQDISSEYERNMRRMEQVVMFETFHETALTPDRDSLIKDLLRGPATPQPFEVQRQAAIENLEEIRSFDGNLKSGADQLALNIGKPTIIRYFYDRAPGFLANVDNKLRWGFFDSVFDTKKYVVDPAYRKPMFVAEGALRLFKRLNYSSPPDLATLTKQIVDHSGQQELWNYYSMPDARVVSVSQIEILSTATADEIHGTWRRNSQYDARWKPTNAKLIDGSIVNNDWALKRYLEERKIPSYMHAYFKLERDEKSGDTMLYEDIRNLPNEFLADNHKGENLISAAVASSVVDRLWQSKIEFRNLEDVERWLVVASQAIHQAVLDRNANGARNNPIYNAHWLQLPPKNKINDLELIRIAYEERLKVSQDGQSRDTIILFKEGLARLYRKIQRNELIRGCSFAMGE